jgi:hypothetical protein
MDGFGVGATYAKSDRTDRQVAAGRVAPLTLAVRTQKFGLLA